MLPPLDPSCKDTAGEDDDGKCTPPDGMDGGEGARALPEGPVGEESNCAFSDDTEDGGGGGGGCTFSEGMGGGGGGGGGCARSEGGEGGGGGGDSLRFLLDRLHEPISPLLIPPFCSSFSSLFVRSTGFAISSSCFLENDLRGRGGGSSTRVCCGTTCTCSTWLTCPMVGLSSSCSSSKVCMPMLSMVKSLGSKVLGVATPVLCPDGVSGEIGSGTLLSSITFPFFQASENRLPIFFEGFLGSILDLFTEKLMAPLG